VRNARERALAELRYGPAFLLGVTRRRPRPASLWRWSFPAFLPARLLDRGARLDAIHEDARA
jgi:hypothetical protein